MKITIFSCLFLLALGSCKSLLTKKYKFNQEFKFKTKEEYFTYLQTKRHINISNVLYVDSASADSFYTYIMDAQLSEYYGTLVNDSTEIKKTEELRDNLTCMGRVLADVNQNILKLSDTSLYVRNDFKKFKFHYASSGQPFAYYDSKNPLKIILLYAYAMGTYFDDFFKEMKDFSEGNNKKADIYIISLDYSFHFK